MSRRACACRPTSLCSGCAGTGCDAGISDSSLQLGWGLAGKACLAAGLRALACNVNRTYSR